MLEKKKERKIVIYLGRLHSLLGPKQFSGLGSGPIQLFQSPPRTISTTRHVPRKIERVQNQCRLNFLFKLQKTLLPHFKIIEIMKLVKKIQLL